MAQPVSSIRFSDQAECGNGADKQRRMQATGPEEESSPCPDACSEIRMWRLQNFTTAAQSTSGYATATHWLAAPPQACSLKGLRRGEGRSSAGRLPGHPRSRSSPRDAAPATGPCPAQALSPPRSRKERRPTPRGAGNPALWSPSTQGFLCRTFPRAASSPRGGRGVPPALTGPLGPRVEGQEETEEASRQQTRISQAGSRHGAGRVGKKCSKSAERPQHRLR